MTIRLLRRLFKRYPPGHWARFRLKRMTELVAIDGVGRAWELWKGQEFICCLWEDEFIK